MPLRIGIVSQAYHPAVGGVTEHVAATSRLLRARGHEVTVVTGRFAGGPGPPEPGVARIGRNVTVRYNGAENNMTVGWGLPRELAALLEEKRFDLLHVHCPISPVLPLLALRLARVPVVGTFHSVSSDRPFRLFGRVLLPFFRRLDRAIAVSAAAREHMTRHFPGPIDIVPNGVDLARFRPGLPRLPRFDDRIPTILFVGRFDPRKGLPELMEACAQLALESVPFRLVLVGDGSLRSRLEPLARGEALQGRVHFEGRVGHDRLPDYYASADLFCSPARGGESFGLVLLEAMASGLPVVATNLPGYRTVVTPDREGILVPARDPTSLKFALRRLLTDPARRARMGAQGIATARAFGWSRVVDGLEEIYTSLVPGRIARPASPARRERAAMALEAAAT